MKKSQWIPYIWDKSEVKVKVAQSCLTLCHPMDYSVHEILQSRILEWDAIALSLARCKRLFLP